MPQPSPANKAIARLERRPSGREPGLPDAENARATAAANLGATASKADIDAMTAEIENAKYSEIETLMTKDVAVNPSEPVLWIHLAQAELGLKNYLDAETNYKKALDLESKTGRPQPEIMGAANAGLGEVYARTLMVDEANAAFDAAAKADPASAATYLRNQAIIFFQEKNAPAQVDAADEAIKADPNEAILYYIKAQGLAEKATSIQTTKKILLPPDCVAAFRKYLELAPNGPFAAEVTRILQRAEEQYSILRPLPSKLTRQLPKIRLIGRCATPLCILVLAITAAAMRPAPQPPPLPAAGENERRPRKIQQCQRRADHYSG